MLVPSIGWMSGIRRGPQFGAIPLPLTTGVDISGAIDVIGEDVAGWHVGDEVTMYSLITCGECEFCRAGEVTVCPQHKIIGEHMNGGLAEYLVVPARNLIAKPKHLSHVEVAALPVVAGTAWHMLITIARLQAGETVFIPGAGGGVASMGIQIAKYAGATVIASTSTPEKMAQARELGADHVVNYRDADWVEQVLAAKGGRGVDVAQDLVGAMTWADSLRTLARNGRMGRLWFAFWQAIRPAHTADLPSSAEHPRRQRRKLQRVADRAGACESRGAASGHRPRPAAARDP